MQMPSAPMSSGSSSSVFQDWINALTKPNEQTFVTMAASPNAKATTAYLWVFVGFLVEFILSLLVGGGAALSSAMAQQGAGGNLPGGGIGAALIAAVCGGPIFAVIGTAIWAGFAALTQWLAKMFKGTGTYDQTAYCVGAVTAPWAMVAGVLSLFGAIPFVGFCFRIVIALAGLYILVLSIMAVKGVHHFGWGEAAGAVLIPGAVIFLVCCCVLVIGISAAGLSMQSFLNQLQQGSGSGY